jgi:hypothetical protein
MESAKGEEGWSCRGAGFPKCLEVRCPKLPDGTSRNARSSSACPGNLCPTLPALLPASLEAPRKARAASLEAPLITSPVAQRSTPAPAVRSRVSRKGRARPQGARAAGPPVSAARARSAKERHEQGRRHLVVNSQVSAGTRRSATARRVPSARHFRMPLLPHRAKRGSGFPAGNPRLWKIFPFIPTPASLPGT